MRIVSLLASGPGIVCGLGAGKGLVGRSHECDNPDWVRKLPVCARPAFDIEMSSKEIDAEVRRRLKEGELLYYVDGELIRRLEPDLLITQEHCQVCAVTPGDVARTGCEGLAHQVLALALEPSAAFMTGYLRWGKQSTAHRPPMLLLRTSSNGSTRPAKVCGKNQRRPLSFWNGPIQFFQRAIGDPS